MKLRTYPCKKIIQHIYELDYESEINERLHTELFRAASEWKEEPAEFYGKSYHLVCLRTIYLDSKGRPECIEDRNSTWPHGHTESYVYLQAEDGWPVRVDISCRGNMIVSTAYRKYTTIFYYEAGVCVTEEGMYNEVTRKEEAAPSLIPDIFEYYGSFESVEWDANGFSTRLVSRGMGDEHNTAYAVMECEYIDMKE